MGFNRVLIEDLVYYIQKRRSMETHHYIPIEYAKTECDSSQEIEYEPLYCKTNPLKHKTELCKTYSELGYCNYGEKCRFAHGRQELIQLPVNLDLRKRKCNGYWGKGVCNYGVRCQFGHGIEKREDALVLQIARGHLAAEPKQQGKLLKILDSHRA